MSAEAPNRVVPVVATLVVASVEPGRRVYSTEAFLPTLVAWQPRYFVVMSQQLRVLDKSRLPGSYGTLSDETLHEAVRAALWRFLELNL